MSIETEPTDLQDDNTFLQYVSLHSQTERALFHKGHLVRLYNLAGKTEQAELIGNGSNEFLALHSDKAQPLVDEALARMSGTPNGGLRVTEGDQ